MVSQRPVGVLSLDAVRPDGFTDYVSVPAGATFVLIRGTGAGGVARPGGLLNPFFALSFFGRLVSLWPLSFLATVSLLARHLRY